MDSELTLPAEWQWHSETAKCGAKIWHCNKACYSHVPAGWYVHSCSCSSGVTLAQTQPSLCLSPLCCAASVPCAEFKDTGSLWPVHKATFGRLRSIRLRPTAHSAGEEHLCQGEPRSSVRGFSRGYPCCNAKLCIRPRALNWQCSSGILCCQSAVDPIA